MTVRKSKYRRAVEWIALNDEPEWLDLEDIANMISVVLIADVFNKECGAVATDVIQFREKQEE